MSPRNDQRRPVAGTGVEMVERAASTVTAEPNTAAQIRRRRVASYRCTALADGRRDPLDPAPRQATIKVRAIGKSTVELAGCDRAVFRAITDLCVRYRRAVGGGAWLIEQSAADDVLALLEHRGYRLEVAL